MSAQVSNYLKDKLLDHILRNTAYTQAATVYVALFTSDPTAAGSGTEVSGGSYARQSVAFAAVSSHSTANSAEIAFPVATGSWGTVTHFGIFDASTSGNLLFYGALSASQAVTTDNQVRFSAGQITATFL